MEEGGRGGGGREGGRGGEGRGRGGEGGRERHTYMQMQAVLVCNNFTIH